MTSPDLHFVYLAPHSNQASSQPGSYPGISNVLQDSGSRVPLTAPTPFSLVKALALHPFQWAVCLWHPQGPLWEASASIRAK